MPPYLELAYTVFIDLECHKTIRCFCSPCSSQPSIAGQPRSSRVVTNMLLLVILAVGVRKAFDAGQLCFSTVTKYLTGCAAVLEAGLGESKVAGGEK